MWPILPELLRPNTATDESLIAVKLCLRRIIRFILVGASDIHAGKDYLEYHHCPSPRVPAPDDPKRIAQQEAPKTDHPANLSQGANKPGSHNRHDHRRPLKSI